MSKLDDDQRRALMARFRGKNTKPEILVRRALHAAGRRFRLHSSSLPGSPDIVMAKDRTVILVHGCFWHAHEGCGIARTPAARKEFWEAKFKANRERDKRVIAALQELGWRVVVIWECEAKSDDLKRRLTKEGLIQ